MTYKLQTYTKYKNSTIEWFPTIPLNWKINRGKFYFRNHKEINKTMACDNVLSLTMNGVLHRDQLGEGGLLPTSYETFQIFEKDNLVFKLIDLENYKTSRVGIVPEKGIMSSAYIRLMIRNKDTNPRYFYWLYFNLYLQGIYNFLGMGVRSTLNYRDLLELPIIIPNKEAQKRIADFLDEKTKIIDGLVAKKEKMIELLHEKRTVLITQAVTKGLDPNSKMKPSGVDWLGDIPEGWKMTKLRREVIFQNGHGFPNEIQGRDKGEFPFLKVSDINGEKINISSARNYVSNFDIKSHSWKKIPVGSVLTAKIGAALAVNHRKINDVECIIDNNMLAFILRKKSWLYLKYFFMLSKSIDLNWFVNPGAVPSVNMFQLKELLIPVPKKDQQKQITDFLNTKNIKINKTITLIGLQIDQLKEYRSSLIYSAVTGKIKV
jgi:type I restriction enzyme S subunit